MNEQEDVIQDPVDGSVDLARELYDKIKIRSRVKAIYSDGSRSMTDVYKDDKDHRGPVDYKISMWITYYPDDNNPIIHTDYISNAVEEVLKTILDIVPEIMSYPKEVLEKFSFNVGNETVYYKEGILHVMDLITSAEKNMIYTYYGLHEVLQNPRAAASLYVLQNPPRFSDDYPLAMDKAIKKLKTVYKALEKGKWKGHEFELRSATYVVHQRHQRYDKESRIIYPDFELSISAGYPYLDGESIGYMEDKELASEFQKFITNKFNHFGIRFS